MKLSKPSRSTSTRRAQSHTVSLASPERPLPQSLRAPVDVPALKAGDLAPLNFRALDRQQFAALVTDFVWTRRVWRVDMHHTWYPTHASYDGVGAIERMDRFHRHERGFDCIAQHVSIAPDGTIWTGRDWNKTPASVGYGMNDGVFMFEVIGNFDHGHDPLAGAQLASVITVIETVQARFRLPVQALLFHRDVPQTEKTCPGTTVDKGDILRRVRVARLLRGSGTATVCRNAVPV
jgi:N-acetylmuramoyl-L-alanine amidase